MNTYNTFINQLLRYYFFSSFISVIGCGGVLIATTLEIQKADIPVLILIILLSFCSMALLEVLKFLQDRKPILIALQSPNPTLKQLENAYKQTHLFPILTCMRILIPHFLGFSVPAVLLTTGAIYYEWLTLSYIYVLYGFLSAVLIASMHAMIEYYKTTIAIEPIIKKLQEMAYQHYQHKLTLKGKVLVPIRTKFQFSSIVIGAFPLLLFSLATQVRLTQEGHLLIEHFWIWSMLVLIVGVCLSIYGAKLLLTIVMRPLDQLTSDIASVEKGNFTRETADFYSDEFSRLVHGYNHMVAGLQERETKNIKMNESFFTTLAAALDARDPYTSGHSERVAVYAVAIGEKVGLSQAELTILKKTGLLHDIGKIAVPDAILLKDGHLTDEEFQLIKQHPVRGEEILQQIQPREIMAKYIPGVRSHHERIDGLGYPDQLHGDQIPIYGRILAVADAFDAMTSDRPYRKGMTKEKALQILISGKGTQWEPLFVDYFIEWIMEKEHIVS